MSFRLALVGHGSSIREIQEIVAETFENIETVGIEMPSDERVDEAAQALRRCLPELDGVPEYYVKMVIAWYFATALAKQSDAALPYIKAQRLDKWTHNKAIQKALESYRVDNEKKVYLRKLKV